MLLTKRTRIMPDVRKSLILDKALLLAESNGYNNFSSIELGKACDCGHSLIFHHFPSMVILREELMRKAIEESNLTVIGQGLANKDAVALSAPDALKRKALKALTT